MITRNEIEAIIEKLADKNKVIDYEFIYFIRQCPSLEDWMNSCPNPEMFTQECNCAIPDEVFIGDVLAKMDLRMKHDAETVGGDELRDFWGEAWRQVMIYWKRCGFSKSLQQIFDDSGWEEGYIQDGKFFPSECTVEIERLKDPSAQSLGEYLLTIFKV